MNTAEQVQLKLAEVQQVLEERTPGLPALLRTIHQQLKKDPDVVTLLSEEECNVMVEGLKEYTKIELTTQALKSKPKKALKNTTVADL